MRIDVDGGSLHLKPTGRGAPILLLHGWPLDHRIFEPQIACIQQCLRVIAFDRRGFGRSQAPPDLGREPDDIERILDALDIGSVHLLGMSQGARIALRFAVTRRERVRSLILQAPVIDGFALDEPDPERIPLEQYAKLARAGSIDEVRRRWLAHPMMALADEHADARRRVEEIIAGYEGKDLLDYSPARYTFPHDVLESLATLDTHCLVLTGAADTAARRAHAQRLVESLPRAHEVVLRHSGHLGNLTEAEAYNRQVVDFCRGVDGNKKANGENCVRNWRS